MSFTSANPPKPRPGSSHDAPDRATVVMDEFKKRFSQHLAEMHGITFKPANPELFGNDSYVLTTAASFSRQNLKDIGLTEFSRQKTEFEEADFFKSAGALGASQFTIGAKALEDALQLEFPERGI